jgi:asparagine synthase (glutamine-hydrolysing)
MCGIAGFIGNFPAPTAQHLSAKLAHRGPDGHGLWGAEVEGQPEEKASISLIHRRLSIIDTSTAASQPMSAVNGRYMVVFNGEIYNYQSLVPPLVKAGYVFNTNSDTAVLAPLFHAHGAAFTEYLEGMFALGIYDNLTATLTLVRDHAGIKPLYYAHTAQGLVFASELKALVGVEGVDTTLSPHALADYLTLLWSPGERTPFVGIKKLLPGHSLTAKQTKNGVQLEILRWYKPPQAPLLGSIPQYNTNTTPAHLRQLFHNIVAEQCTADVPIGAFLSGGVDSSCIVASMVATGHAPKQTYCIGFTGKGMAEEGFSDDLTHAELVAKHLGVPLKPLLVDVETLLERLPNMAYVLDEPTADPSPLFVEDIAKAALADGIKVLLGGTGGDDIFSGYRRHQTARLREKMASLCQPAGMALALAAPFTGLFGEAKKRRISVLSHLLKVNNEQFLLDSFQTNSSTSGWQLLAPELRQKLKGGYTNALHTAREESRGQSLLNRLLYMELFGFLPDHNLNYNDKASMLQGVEGRVPFTDKRLISWMADVDPALKMNNFNAKGLLKEAFKHDIPASVFTRSKAGFGAPMRKLLTGAGRGLVEDTLFGTDAKNLLDATTSKALWQSTLSGKTDGTYTILAACMLVWWHRRMVA